MVDVRAQIAEVLRGRILRGIRGGALRRGDRLPSTRELNREFNADQRILLDALRILAKEGLLELRPRGGVYVLASGIGDAAPAPSTTWLSSLFSQGVAREISLMELHEWMRRAVETRRIRVAVIRSTLDELGGICQELEEDYGVEASPIHVDALECTPLPHDLRSADLLITTGGTESVVRAVAELLGKPLIIVRIAPDLIGSEWRLLLMRPVYVVVKDEAFVDVLRSFFTDIPGSTNMRAMVLGKDDLSVIPEDAAVYITRTARSSLGAARLGGNHIPTARAFSAESSRAIIEFIVNSNLRAFTKGQNIGQ